MPNHNATVKNKTWTEKQYNFWELSNFSKETQCEPMWRYLLKKIKSIKQQYSDSNNSDLMTHLEYAITDAVHLNMLLLILFH